MKDAAPELTKALHNILEFLVGQRLRRIVSPGQPSVFVQEPLVFPIRSEADRAEWLARNYAAKWRAQGWVLAPKFMEFYLSGRGRGDKNTPDLPVSRSEALAFQAIRDAVATNVERFTVKTLQKNETKDQEDTEDTPATNAQQTMFELNQPDGPEHRTFTDFWDIDFQNPSLGSMDAGNFEQFVNEPDLFLATGESKFRSLGRFDGKRRGEVITIEATITHTWEDVYNFHGVFGRNAIALERENRARPFTWRAQWKETYAGALKIYPQKTKDEIVNREWVILFRRIAQ